MDFDLHFGRFFGPKIDVFEKFLLPDFELQLEVRSAKIVILPRENAVFYKIDILALKWQPMKNIKKQEKIASKSTCFFAWIFLGFWSQLGWILASKLDPPKLIATAFFPSCGQEASKRRPRGSKSVPRASQEPQTASQEGPRVPKSDQNVPRARPKCLQRVTFLRISLLFYVFLRFSGF